MSAPSKMKGGKRSEATQKQERRFLRCRRMFAARQIDRLQIEMEKRREIKKESKRRREMSGTDTANSLCR